MEYRRKSYLAKVKLFRDKKANPHETKMSVAIMK